MFVSQPTSVHLCAGTASLHRPPSLSLRQHCTLLLSVVPFKWASFKKRPWVQQLPHENVEKKKKKEKYEKAEEDLCHLWGPQIWVLLVKPTVHWTPLLWLPHINKLHCLAFLFFPSNICITYRHSADRPEECEIKCLFNAYLPYSMSGCNTDKLFREN